MMKENVYNEFNKHDMNQQSVISQIHQNKIRSIPFHLPHFTQNLCRIHLQLLLIVHLDTCPLLPVVQVLS